MKETEAPYYYIEEIDDNKTVADEIVSVLMKLFQPKSVVDFGCGLGNFIISFKEKGVPTVLGLDGAWAKTDPLFKIKSEEEFKEVDLTKFIQLERKFDLAICLEVAEHLFPKDADTFLKNLTSASDVIVFSAAVPGQGGIHHVNEQWIPYWQEKFLQHNFILQDILRPVLWNNEKISWWYRQNIYLVTHKDFPLDHSRFEALYTKEPINKLHPGLLKTRNEEMQYFLDGNAGVTGYFKLLVKALAKKSGNHNQPSVN